MRRTLKLGLYCTFLLGVIDIGFDILRFVTIQLSLVRAATPITLVGECGNTFGTLDKRSGEWMG